MSQRRKQLRAMYGRPLPPPNMRSNPGAQVVSLVPSSGRAENPPSTIEVPAHVRARVPEGAVIVRATQRMVSRNTLPGRGCYPGFCLDDHGMICCVTGGNTHLCIMTCFAYEWPGQGLGPQQDANRRIATTAPPRALQLLLRKGAPGLQRSTGTLDAGWLAAIPSGLPPAGVTQYVRWSGGPSGFRMSTTSAMQSPVQILEVRSGGPTGHMVRVGPAILQNASLRGGSTLSQQQVRNRNPQRSHPTAMRDVLARRAARRSRLSLRGPR
jgi:hypothetical protein